MGLFDFLFKKPVIVNDALFGELRFINTRDKAMNFFEAYTFFQPSNGNIEIHIEGNLPGPDEEQKQFFVALQEDYDKYIPQIQTAIETEFRHWEKDFTIKHFKQEFTPVFLEIPRFNQERSIWSISFDTTNGKGHEIVVYFHDGEIDEVVIDG
ncbi:hypothetical protein SAMN05428949_0621 [Chitinophaga sp. YR627]|uniref:hypothetical protein n=1 Tax=Chitinophaga sp. YR627 TaxID=1881041 RepID=UPI0008EEECA7|nr:hypothetical protein [Chitinophaga sp. YR627]SFM73933.1 hypothetical protein SAMN05428949_0621 [Chitinophaga sp. YR627]